MSSYEHRSSVPEGSIVNCKYPGPANARHVVGIVCADADSQSAVSRHAEPCAGRSFGRSHTNSMLTARRSPPVQCAIIRGKGARRTNENDRDQDADRTGSENTVAGREGHRIFVPDTQQVLSEAAG